MRTARNVSLISGSARVSLPSCRPNDAARRHPRHDMLHNPVRLPLPIVSNHGPHHAHKPQSSLSRAHTPPTHAVGCTQQVRHGSRRFHNGSLRCCQTLSRSPPAKVCLVFHPRRGTKTSMGKSMVSQFMTFEMQRTRDFRMTKHIRATQKEGGPHSLFSQVARQFQAPNTRPIVKGQRHTATHARPGPPRCAKHLRPGSHNRRSGRPRRWLRRTAPVLRPLFPTRSRF